MSRSLVLDTGLVVSPDGKRNLRPCELCVTPFFFFPLPFLFSLGGKEVKGPHTPTGFFVVLASDSFPFPLP